MTPCDPFSPHVHLVDIEDNDVEQGLALASLLSHHNHQALWKHY